MNHKNAFAIWVTGLPASGKSTLAIAIEKELAARHVDVAVLESDALRQVFTPKARYTEAERDKFYSQIAYLGALLTAHGVPVIFDATANRRKYREQARQQIPRFVEVYVDTPLEVCAARDPKKIYRKARAGASGSVPGAQAVYEAPTKADLIVHGEQEPPETAARRVLAELAARNYIPAITNP